MDVRAALLDALRAQGRVLLTGPIGPDGDSLGACLALQRVLRGFGVDAQVAGEVSYRYAWMPGADGVIRDAEVLPDWPAVVVLDGDRHRLTPSVDAAFARADVRAIVDHHGSTQDDGYTHFWLEPTASSTCDMLYRALPGWGVGLDRPLAELLYAGAIFDTGGFRYTNTTPATHRMAAELLEHGIDHGGICLAVLMDRRLAGLRLAGETFSSAVLELDGQVALAEVGLAQCERLGVVEGDLEGLVEALVQVHGVEVSVLCVERPDGRVKLSLRSRGAVNVARVARTITAMGGGHAKAAGATLPHPGHAALKQRVLEVLGAELGAVSPARG